MISIADILEKYSGKFLVAFDLGHYWFNETNKISDFTDVAKEQNIEFIEYDKETIGFESKFLTKLLTDFSHYNFTLFDSVNELSFEQVYEDFFICKSHDWKSEERLLPKLNNSSLYVSSHDDCYLHIETKKLALLNEIFVRNLQFLVITKDFQNRFTESELETFNEIIEVEIADLPDNILKKIFSKTTPISVLQENITIDGRIFIMPISLQKFNFQKEQEYKIDCYLRYDFNSHQWELNQ